MCYEWKWKCCSEVCEQRRKVFRVKPSKKKTPVIQHFQTKWGSKGNEEVNPTLPTPYMFSSSLAVWTSGCKPVKDFKKQRKSASQQDLSSVPQTFSGAFSQLLSKPRLLSLTLLTPFSLFFTFLFLSEQKSRTSSLLVCHFCFEARPKPGAKLTVSREKAKKTKTHQPSPNLKNSFDHLALKTLVQLTLKHPTSH